MSFSEWLLAIVGAAATGAGRDTVSSAVNPGFVGVPVAPIALIEDATVLAVGAGTAYLGAAVRAPGLGRLGDGLLLGQSAYAGQDLTHTLRRYLTKSPQAAGTPQQIAAAGMPPAPPAPPAPAATPALVPSRGPAAPWWDQRDLSEQV